MPQTQINCPQCQQPIVADIRQLFDIGEYPQDKQVFLSGAYNVANCPHCGFQGMLGSPLVYHDPEKELLLTFFPPEMGLPVNEQERVIGPLIQRVVDNLPQEQRKGYLFNPRMMLTFQGMMETVLEAEGITKEMIQGQEERMKLIEQLLAASPESRLEIIKQEDEKIDSDLFSILNTLMQTAVYSQDENAAQHLNALSRLLLENSTQGKALKADSDEIQGAMQDLQNLGENLNRESLLDLVLASSSDVRLRAYVQFARMGMDYEFFGMLSSKIDTASSDEQEKLNDLRGKLLEYTAAYDQEAAARADAARKNVETLLQAPNLEEAVKQNMEAIDDLFVQTVTSELAEARKSGNLDRSSRLQQILDVIESAQTPPEELGLIEELMDDALDEDALAAKIADHSDEVTPEVLQVLTSLIAQGQSVIEEAEGDAKSQQENALDRLQKIYEGILRFVMKQNMQA